MQATYPQIADSYRRLVETVARLRAPGGCPWDREQTHSSLTECLIEECAELIEAIDRGDYLHMREELGDLLLNVLMQAEIANESGAFSMREVADDINDKLIRRHPHVFDPQSVKADTPETVLKRWDEIKASEKQRPGSDQTQNKRFKSLPPRLPALLFAKKVYKQAQKLGLSEHAALPHESIRYYTETSEDTLAETLFAIAAACRARGKDPELLLRSYTDHCIWQMDEPSHEDPEGQITASQS